jgi:plasmid maintenance system killer protein
MNITFATKALQKQLNEEKELVKIHGTVRARTLKIVLASLRAAPTLSIFAPPMSPPHRCHELTGNRKGQLSVDIDHPYRLLFEPNHDPLPMRGEGGLDWKQISNIEILGIEDTHG